MKVISGGHGVWGRSGKEPDERYWATSKGAYNHPIMHRSDLTAKLRGMDVIGLWEETPKLTLTFETEAMKTETQVQLTNTQIQELLDNLDEIQTNQQEAQQILLYHQRNIYNTYYPTLLESPYASPDPHTKAIYYTYTLLAARLLTKHGHNPLASHLYYTQFLDDEITAQRQLGFILARKAFGEVSRSSMVASDFGLSSGMINGINMANASWKPVFYLQLFPNKTQQEITKILEPANYAMAIEHRIEEINKIIDKHFMISDDDTIRYIRLGDFVITEEQARDTPYKPSIS